jgi:hypothetical protein
VIVGGDLRGGSNTATAGVTVSSPLYGTCNLAAWNETCYFPFVSGVPETFAINVWATAEGSADYLGVSAEAVITGFECFDVSGAGPCNFNVPAQPVPESGTYLPTALASAAFIARNRRRSRCGSKADSNRVLHNI